MVTPRSRGRPSSPVPSRRARPSPVPSRRATLSSPFLEGDPLPRSLPGGRVTSRRAAHLPQSLPGGRVTSWRATLPSHFLECGSLPGGRPSPVTSRRAALSPSLFPEGGPPKSLPGGRPSPQVPSWRGCHPLEDGILRSYRCRTRLLRSYYGCVGCLHAIVRDSGGSTEPSTRGRA